MAQIFVSHSNRDKNDRDLFTDAFAGTKVKAIFEEFEKLDSGQLDAQKIAKDIEDSNALFLVIGRNVQHVPHTRDWVVWEAGVGKNKDIWVFEELLPPGEISVVVPYLKHYVVFQNNDQWLAYLRRIIQSYDDSHVLPTSVLTGALGAALADDEVAGAAIGAVAGLFLSDRSGTRPTGFSVSCSNCSSSYSLHIQSSVGTFRCPVCNSRWALR